MRIAFTLLALLALASFSHAAVPSLEKKLADLEQRLISLQNDLKELRQELAAAKSPILTPPQAQTAYHKDPRQLMTIEFIVKSVGWLGWLAKDQHPINFRITSDAPLENGIFCVDVNGLNKMLLTAIDLPNEKPKVQTPVPIPEPGQDVHKPLLDLVGKTLRVTGRIRYSAGKDRPEGGANYYIIDVDGVEELAVVK
jgi:hypothetical protein